MRLLLAVVILASGCISIPEYDMPKDNRSNSVTTGVFRGLDPGAKEEAGLHFRVKAYGSTRAREILQEAELQYQRIMNDSGLYSFSPRALYEIVVYSSQDEFHKKTQFASWAAGLTVGNAIYTYDGPGLAPTLAHEMTHLIFHEYMGDSRQDLRWLNEGFAMYEESRALGGPGVAFPSSQEPSPFHQMVGLIPATERERQVHLWYKQVGDVVGYLVERGGRVGMGQFFSALRERRPVDESLRTGFPGVWSSMQELEAAWRRKVSDAGR